MTIKRNISRGLKPPNGNLGEWIRFASSALLIPSIIAAAVFCIRVERFMSEITVKMDNMVTKDEFESRLSSKVDKSDVPAPEVKEALSNLKEGQVILSAQLEQLRRDVIELIVKKGRS